MSNLTQFQNLNISGLFEWYQHCASPAVKKAHDGAIRATRFWLVLSTAGFYFPLAVLVAALAKATHLSGGHPQFGDFLLGAFMWMAIFGALRVRLKEKLRLSLMGAIEAMDEQFLAGSNGLPVAMSSWNHQDTQDDHEVSFSQMHQPTDAYPHSNTRVH